MKLNICKNPVVVHLSHFTGKDTDDFRLVNGVEPQFRIKKNTENWRSFYLPFNTVLAWYNYDNGISSPTQIEIDNENLFYTDWKQLKGITKKI